MMIKKLLFYLILNFFPFYCLFSEYNIASVALPNNNIMVCGGIKDTTTISDECFILNSTATISTSGGTYFSTNSLNTERANHTMTLLPDGRVLVLGGYTSVSFYYPLSDFPEVLITTGVPTVSAEVCQSTPPYTCTNIPNMITARAGHTATLLSYGPDAGNVLICGGQSAANTVTNTCEIFITSTTQFKNGPSMISNRFGHSASLLSNGKVLISGGITSIGNPPNFTPTQELYDPITNTFAPAPAPLFQSRIYHSATVLNNGNVAIIGGYNNYNGPDIETKDSTTTQVAQGQGTWGFVETIEMFDKNGARVPIEAESYKLLPYRVSNHFSTLMEDGSIRTIGGRGNIPVTYYQPRSLTSYLPLVFNFSGMTLGGDMLGTRQLTGAFSGTVQFTEDLKLSRDVTGRILNGDIYYSPPPTTYPPIPSITIGNVDIFLGRTTAELDGAIMGYFVDNNTLVKNLYANLSLKSSPGPLQSNGTITFAPLSLTPNNTPIISTANFSVISPSIPIRQSLNFSDCAGCYVSLGQTNFKLPNDMFSGYTLTGRLMLKQLSVVGDVCSLTLSSGAITSDISGSVSSDILLINSATFYGLTGTIQNTTDHVLTSGEITNCLSGKSSSDLIVDFSFTSDGLNYNPYPNSVSINVGVSTIVVRDMIFSDIATYYPSNANWDFADFKILGADRRKPYPTYDLNVILTESANLFTFMGRSCEEDVSNNCKRDNPILKADNDIVLEYKDIPADTLWNDLKNMINKRGYHTTTVLNDGNILVCGGTDGKESLKTCELYNKITGEWTIVSTMTYARSYHRATLLPNGTVLITGGVEGNVDLSQTLDSSEIYYPQTKTFVPTAPMNYSRAAHTQTLLPNGNVLITGGVSSGTYLSTAEIFITTANTFIPIGNMNNKRANHTATLMKDGKVMIVGGINESSVLNTYEIYDPTTNTFPTVGNINYNRHSHTAHLLEDGRVIIIGGNNGSWTVDKVEVYDGSWKTLSSLANYPIPSIDISNHSSILLPNNKILITGGEKIRSGGLLEEYPKSFFTQFYYILPYENFGKITKRIGHSSVLLPSNDIVLTGGWTGNNYTDSVQSRYYLFNQPDIYGLSSTVERKPHISSATAIFDRGDFITIVSTYSNFHSISDGSNSGSGGHNSDFGKPKVILRGINNEYTIDLSSTIYISTSNSINWNVTLSTIIINAPTLPERLPYGWYYLYVCNTGICSDGYIVQASTPRPTCSIINLQAEESVSTTSIKWNWYLNTVGNSNGFAVFSTSNVFITTVAFPSPLSDPATYYQTGLLPNTPSAIKVGCYNIGGFSDPSTFAVAVSTVYTKANPPKNLRVTYASFDTVDLEWDSDNNPNFTPFRIDVSTYPDFSEYSVALSFANNYKDTKYTIRNLEPNWRYYFRVKARNGNGIETVYDTQNPGSSTFNNPVSTITVGNIVNLAGTPLTTTSIKWSWNKSDGATGYEVWKFMTTIDPNDPIFKSTIDVSVLLSTTPYPYYTQIDLSTNTSYTVKVRSFKNDVQTGFITVFGPFSISEPVYTLAAVPTPASPNVFTNITTGSFVVGWDANGNTDYTTYRLDISQSQDFSSYISYNVETDSITFPLIKQDVYNLKPNYKYYARVYAINKDNLITNNPADLGYKYTLAQPPKRVYVSSISMSGVTVNWDPGENSTDTKYELRATSVSFESSYISTPVPFGLGYKDTSYRVNGLWIQTTYYFDVSAMNMEGVETARIQTTTPAVTLPGPAGAPPSSISGLTDPSIDTTISGLLSDNRPVSLFVPKEAFNTPQPIAIAKLNNNVCGYTFGGSTLTFGIYANEQPYTPLTFTFDYYSLEAVNPSNQPDIHTYKSRVTLARYNPDTGQCLPVKTTIDEGLRKITAEINHFSIYQLIILNPASDLNNIKVFPNPFYPNKPGQGTITIINLPTDSKLTFYTLSGQKVYETTSDTTGTAYWSGKNTDGQFVGSGVYLCVVKSKSNKKILKVAIER